MAPPHPLTQHTLENTTDQRIVISGGARKFFDIPPKSIARGIPEWVATAKPLHRELLKGNIRKLSEAPLPEPVDFVAEVGEMVDAKLVALVKALEEANRRAAEAEAKVGATDADLRALVKAQADAIATLQARLDKVEAK